MRGYIAMIRNGVTNYLNSGKRQYTHSLTHSPLSAGGHPLVSYSVTGS